MQMKIVRTIIYPSLVDALRMKLTCTAAFKKNYKFVDMEWTGMKSIWVTQSKIIKEKGLIKRYLIFSPWLYFHKGDYDCHLIIKDNHNSKFMLNKTMKVVGKYVSST